jgi:hypothetical protein
MCGDNPLFLPETVLDRWIGRDQHDVSVFRIMSSVDRVGLCRVSANLYHAETSNGADRSKQGRAHH